MTLLLERVVSLAGILPRNSARGAPSGSGRSTLSLLRSGTSVSTTLRIFRSI